MAIKRALVLSFSLLKFFIFYYNSHFKIRYLNIFYVHTHFESTGKEFKKKMKIKTGNHFFRPSFEY